MAKKKKTSRRSGREGTAGGVASKLREMGRGWKDTVPRAGGGGFPLGRDQEGIIEKVEIGESQENNLQVVWTLVGTSDGIKDDKHWKRSMLMTPQNREYLRGEMETIGLTWPDTIDDLGDALAEAEGMAVRFDVVQGKDEFVNLYFRERLEGGNGGSNDKDKDVGGDEYTKKEIIQLGKDEDEDALTALAEECGLKESAYDTWPDLADACIDELGL